VSQNGGLAGGYPGNTGLEVLVRGADVHAGLAEGRIPQSVTDLGGDAEIAPCYAQSSLAPGEVLYMHWQGGGGYGDPLLRDPEAVAEDVREFKVSAQAAEDIYGAVLTGGQVDADATAARREAIRGQRRAGSAASGAAAVKVDLANARRIDDNLVQAGTLVACGHCGWRLADTSTDSELALLRHEGPSAEAGPQIMSSPSEYVDDEVVFRQLVCPGCLTAVYSAVVPKAHVDHVADVSRFSGAHA
jgi:N-methylhydantoinase B